jgi:hypothetical protein
MITQADREEMRGYIRDARDGINEILRKYAGEREILGDLVKLRDLVVEERKWVEMARSEGVTTRLHDDTTMRRIENDKKDGVDLADAGKEEKKATDRGSEGMRDRQSEDKEKEKINRGKEGKSDGGSDKVKIIKKEKKKGNYQSRAWMLRHYVDLRMTLREIGILEGVSETVIFKWIHKHQIPVRGKAESQVKERHKRAKLAVRRET